METMIKFVTVLAWIFGTLSGLLVIGRIAGAMSYSNLERQLDLIRGRVVTFPVMKPGILFIVCVAWLLSV